MSLPEPYYEDKKAGITLYCADCRDILPLLGPVDLVLTDPPYGNGTTYGLYDDSPDNLRELIRESVPHILRIGKATLITCGVGNIHAYPPPRWILSWITPAGNGSGPWGFCCWQPILAYGSDPYLVEQLGRRQDCYIHTELSEQNGHPCPKPIKLMRWLVIRGTTSPTATILDPFMGSGTTLRAAKDLGRRAIGIEIEEKYCEIAVKRLAQEVMPL